MKIEKLRNNHKKEIIIGTILTVVIGGALTFRLTHSKYRVTQSIDLGSGVINYKVPDFKIMAMYKNDGSGDISIDSMPTSGYVINEEKTYCTSDGTAQVKGKIKTISGNHVISGLNKGDKCYLYFDKQLTGGDYILANMTVNDETPDFSQIADIDEGVYKAEDGMYGSTNENKKYTYYWRGAVTNNYVKFAGFCWRIIRINGDKTIRLIYDGTTCHTNGTKTTESIAVTSKKYNLSYNQSNYVGWTYTGSSQRTLSGTASNAKTQLESWYSSNIGNNETYSAKVIDGKFCNDRDVGSGFSWAENGNTFYYVARTRLEINKNPTFNCRNVGDVYTLKVGLITADEVAFAGGVHGSSNSSYYLYNGQSYWTISPYCWDGYSAYTSARMYVECGSNGLCGVLVDDYSGLGLRPVINLRSDVTFSSGDGTQNSPYVVS